MPSSLRPRPEKREPSPDPSSDLDTDSDPSPSPTHAARRARKFLKSSAGEQLEMLEDEGGAQLINGRAWHPKEDQVLLAAYDKFGPTWKAVSDALAPLGTKRTPAMCRNRHQRIKAPLKPGREGKNRCKRCGQIKRGHTCTAVVAPPAQPAAATQVVRPVVPPKAVVRAPAAAAAMTAAAMTAAARAPTDVSVGLVPEHPLLPPVTGNGFQVDYKSLLRDQLRHQHANARRNAQGWTDDFLFSLQGGPDAFGHTTPARAAPPASYLASPAPPPVAPAARPLAAPLSLGGLAATRGTDFSQSMRSLGGLSFGGASIISDDADMVDLGDLQSAADAALGYGRLSFDARGGEPGGISLADDAEVTTGGALTPGPAPDDDESNDQPQAAAADGATLEPEADTLSYAGPLGFAHDGWTSLASSQSSAAPSSAPALMPLPSWSRMPSFSFAERPQISMAV